MFYGNDLFRKFFRKMILLGLIQTAFSLSTISSVISEQSAGSAGTFISFLDGVSGFLGDLEVDFHQFHRPEPRSVVDLLKLLPC